MKNFKNNFSNKNKFNDKKKLDFKNDRVLSNSKDLNKDNRDIKNILEEEISKFLMGEKLNDGDLKNLDAKLKRIITDVKEGETHKKEIGKILKKLKFILIINHLIYASIFHNMNYFLIQLYV